MSFVNNYQGAVNPGGGGVPDIMDRGFGMDGTMTFDPGLDRPYKDKNGRLAVTVNTGRTTLVNGVQTPIKEHRYVADMVNQGLMRPVNNATTLRKEEWIELDRVVLREARLRLRAYADLAAANTFGGFNGMSKMILEHETMSDVGEAIVDMSPMTEGRTDAPLFQLQGLPLPITHSDFWYDARRLAISRNTGTPLDMTMGEAAARRVAESIERVTIGIDTGIAYGGNSTYVGGYSRTSQVYGYLNFPQRVTSVTGYIPTGSGRSGTGWKPSDTLADVLAMRTAMYNQKFYGPWVIYHSNDWDTYMDNDYILTGGNVATQTLRERLKSIENITDVRRLDFLRSTVLPAGDPAQVNTAFPFRMLMVQLTSDVARAVNGMDMTTVQWETMGGMRQNFKVMCIQVPQLRATFAGNCGIMDTQFTK